MFLVFSIAALIWWVGGWLGFRQIERGGALGLLWICVVGMQLIFPEGHLLREMTGRDPGPWFSVGFFSVIGVVYMQIVGVLRRKAEANELERKVQALPKDPNRLSPDEQARYARHIVLREIGGPGQQRLKRAHVLVVGAGGLGSPALLYLAGAGIGRITLVDEDKVDRSNLQRQVIHRSADQGRPKVESAADAMAALNPHVKIRAYPTRLTEENGPVLVADADLILDGTDNFATRYTVNALAVAAKIPLISGALSQWEGQISVFDPSLGAPCYQCIFPEAPAEGLAPSCAEAGVLGPLPGVVGAMMAAEAVKLLAGAGQPLLGAMLIYDALYGESRRIALKPRSDCPVCGGL